MLSLLPIIQSTSWATSSIEKMSQIIKVILGGPSHSGKSCLREGLKQAIMPFHRIGQAPYPYVLTACPDGEGAWYSEAARCNPALAQQLKEAYKAKFTQEFADIKAEQVRNLPFPLNIVDVGGKIDDKNRLIMAPATHAVILANDMSLVGDWKAVCEELDLRAIAVIHSDYEGTRDRIDTEVPILIGSVHHLERGEDVSTRPMVQALAKRLLNLSHGWKDGCVSKSS